MFFGKIVAPFIGTGYKMHNTRAVPLVRQEDAHKGRVSFLPYFHATWRGGA